MKQIITLTPIGGIHLLLDGMKIIVGPPAHTGLWITKHFWNSIKSSYSFKLTKDYNMKELKDLDITNEIIYPYLNRVYVTSNIPKFRFFTGPVVTADCLFPVAMGPSKQPETLVY